MHDLVTITSGYFNPLHVGHLDYFKAAKKLGDFHVVIVNNDKQIALKGGLPCMPELERMEIIEELQCVNQAWLSIDETRIVGETLKLIAKSIQAKKIIFINSGDRPPETLNPDEVKACKVSNIEMKFIPLPKRNASSEIRKLINQEPKE